VPRWQNSTAVQEQKVPADPLAAADDEYARKMMKRTGSPSDDQVVMPKVQVVLNEAEVQPFSARPNQATGRRASGNAAFLNSGRPGQGRGPISFMRTTIQGKHSSSKRRHLSKDASSGSVGTSGNSKRWPTLSSRRRIQGEHPPETRWEMMEKSTNSPKGKKRGGNVVFVEQRSTTQKTSLASSSGGESPVDPQNTTALAHLQQQKNDNNNRSYHHLKIAVSATSFLEGDDACSRECSPSHSISWKERSALIGLSSSCESDVGFVV